MPALSSRRAILGALLFYAVAAPTHALATDPGVFDEKTEKDSKDAKKADPGWVFSINLGAGLALTHISNVVGAQDGVSLTLSASVVGGADYIEGIHDWRNKLALNLAFTQTPALPDLFVKSADSFEFDSAYYLRLVDWVGPFARFGLQTQMLPGQDLRPGPIAYTIDGTSAGVPTTEFDLTDPFQPMTLRQSLGAYFRPYQQPEAELEFRVGVGAREAFADGQLALKDDAATADIIELTALSDSIVVGGEIRAQVKGAIEKGKVAYSAHAELLLPFYDSVSNEKGLSFSESINYDFGAKLSFKLVEWASLDYEFKALYQPQVVEEWQVTNTLLLTFGWGYRHVENEPEKKAAEAKKEAAPPKKEEAPAPKKEEAPAPKKDEAAPAPKTEDAPAPADGATTTDAPKSDAPAPE